LKRNQSAGLSAKKPASAKGSFYISSNSSSSSSLDYEAANGLKDELDR
jgi:hypothetical protein